MSDPRPIGVFDSGVGGLTVVRRLREEFPRESFLFLGDTARLPYGTKSPETVERYSLANVGFLLARDVKFLVVACNTASALALPAIEAISPVPVVGVIEPGAEAAVATGRRRIGVIGTEATIASGAYVHAIARRAADREVIVRACPLFVPLAEEGWTENAVARQTAEIYLSPLRGRIDALVLGCTHYPLLKDTIAAALPGVVLVDSADAVCEAVRPLLSPARRNEEESEYHVCVTDAAERFRAVAERFLGRPIDRLEHVEITGNL
ncbi:MAG TPA: glutamate racemase [Thermoanaerobaculia bacterium]|nr:glutamate racemase [Thermoanaerobaculia bacterium]